jgi:hypothetical protein
MNNKELSKYLLELNDHETALILFHVKGYMSNHATANALFEKALNNAIEYRKHMEVEA